MVGSSLVYGTENTALSNVIDKIIDPQKWEGIQLCESVNRLWVVDGKPLFVIIIVGDDYMGSLK